MSFSLDALRAFTVLAEELHYGRAAIRLHLSQPALTRQIQRLEDEIGGRLFERTTGMVRLSPAGETLLERARALVREGSAFEALAYQAARGEAGSLRVGFGIAAVGAILPTAVLAFRKACPNVLLELRDLGTTRQIEELIQGTLDVGFIRLPSPSAHIEAIPVLEEELLLVAAQPRLASAKIQLRDFRDDPFVLVSRSVSSTYYEHALRLCHTAGFSPQVVQEVNEWFTGLNLVRAGMGVSLAPASTQRMRVPGIRYRSLDDPRAYWRIGIAWRKDRWPLAERFVEIVRTLPHQGTT
ncbi:LysR family transcriptional regulator [Silvibacterium dinghuense]|uniref:LysR family transcriptional regulator n=1 Tax=Silvibacterium dinghuense TaxID=1560006 RepID=A0A4Q1SJL8_9BACT|nr:LysR family transcriptional regulator [Silvibacterium dinghuense]RXS97848.1 LysR family transcriptional regulator [Silvibacterium dinghuense]GGH02468.1 LysR family transcriptional regulator [Silvibacterium dinghuense]